jgi:hypothetical protein
MAATSKVRMKHKPLSPEGKLDLISWVLLQMFLTKENR